MNKIQAQVTEFHQAFKVPVAGSPRELSDKDTGRRLALMQEELGEFANAYLRGDFIESVDALGDLLYVVFGTAVEMGIDMEPIMNEIHKSNMSKLGRNGQPLVSPHGKVIKGPDFVTPDITSQLIIQGY